MTNAVSAADLQWFAQHWSELLETSRPRLRLVSAQPEHHVDRRGTNRRARRLEAIDGTAKRWTLQVDRAIATARARHA